MGFTRVNRTEKTHIKPSDAGLVVVSPLSSARRGRQCRKSRGRAKLAHRILLFWQCPGLDAKGCGRRTAHKPWLDHFAGAVRKSRLGRDRNGMRLWSALSTASEAAVASVKQGGTQRKERIAGC